MRELQKGENFEEIVKKGNYVVDFYASWCNPCRMLAMELETLDANKSNFEIIEIDTESFEELADKYNVKAVPTILFVADGKIVLVNVGFADYKKLKKLTEIHFK